MKKIIYSLLVLATAALAVSCQKDPLDDINDGKWNKERNIIGISFEGQIGEATINRTADDATISFLYSSADFSAVKVKSLELSYGAKASIKVGEALNMDNAQKSFEITVTPVNGEPLTWTVVGEQYINPYEGTWTIQSFNFRWDDWNGWGLQGAANVVDKMSSVAKGLDDVITFGAIEGDENGSFYGSYEREAGADGEFGSYISPAGTDWSSKFGQLPNGKGRYFINPDNTVSFQVEGSNSKITAKGVKETTSTTMTFEMNSPQIWEIDWNDYYSTENQLRMAFEILCVLKK